MKTIDNIMKEIEQMKSQEQQLASMRVLVYMLQRENTLLKEKTEDSVLSQDDEEALEEAKQEVAEKKTVPFTEFKKQTQEPEDISSELGILTDEPIIKKVQQQRVIPQLPKISPEVMERLKKGE